MVAKSRSRIALFAALGAWTFLTSACVHPLGPGYHFDDRQTEIRVSNGFTGLIHFRVVDDLHNSGDRTLHSLEVRLPQGPAFGDANVQLVVAGREVSPQHASRSDFRMMLAPFDPAWEQNEKRQILSEWDLAPEAAARGTIASSPKGFFIADPTALPLWQTPSGFFARGGANPDKELLTISAPPEFRVLAPGKRVITVRETGRLTHHFLLDPRKDYLPYVVAGSYQEKTIPARQGDVEFWTFQPVATQSVQAIAERAASSMNALTGFFGPAAAGKTPVRIMEAPVELPAEFGVPNDPGGISFPGGVLLDARSFQEGIANERVLQLVEYELTRTWFGWVVRPNPDAQILMGRGVGLFGVAVAAEARGPTERRRIIRSLIERYDEARGVAPDLRLMEPPVGYSRNERISTGYRAALFFVALEDLCGRSNLGAALRAVIYARSGSDTDYEDLRAALELQSGLDLGAMFRSWLVRPGIPEDLRARYQRESVASRD